MNPPMNPGIENEPMPQPHDLSHGYTVELSVYPDDTFSVSEPEPLAEEEEEHEPDADEEHIHDLTSAIKRLLNVVRRNPVGDNSQESFDQGFKQ